MSVKRLLENGSMSAILSGYFPDLPLTGNYVLKSWFSGFVAVPL